MTFAPHRAGAGRLAWEVDRGEVVVTTTKSPARRPTLAARRVGYLVSVLVNVLLLIAVNGWPGWEALPFLTADMSLVVGLVNASIVVNLVANLVYLLRDPLWVKALGDLVTTAVGVAASVRMWQVFPFDFGDATFPWEPLARLLLGIAIVGGGIGVVAALVRLMRSLAA